MKFCYPHKLYIASLNIFLIISIYGFWCIYEGTKNYMLLRIGYILFCIAVLIWYYENYRYYKRKYVVIENDYIKIKDEKFMEIISKQNIDYIIVANHRRLLKIHNVTHIFTKDDNYFYFTNELNKYGKFKESLKVSFEKIYIEKNGIIPSNFVVSKENLLSF